MRQSYKTQKRGSETVVLVPLRRWQSDQRKLRKLRQMMKLKNELKQSFREAEEMMSGKRKERTLDDLIHEL